MVGPEDAIINKKGMLLAFMQISFVETQTVANDHINELFQH